MAAVRTVTLAMADEEGQYFMWLILRKERPLLTQYLKYKDVTPISSTCYLCSCFW